MKRVLLGKKPYKCNTSGKGFTVKLQFRSHQMTHKSKEPFRCSACPRVFQWRRNLYIHKRIHIGVYGIGFGVRFQLTKDQQTHTGIKLHKFPLCPDIWKSKLDAHEIVYFRKAFQMLSLP